MRELLSHTFTSRVDAARDAIRAQESRGLVKKSNLKIAPACTGMRRRGTITIDNETAGRYQGELDLMMNTLPADPRVNVCARIAPEDLPLLYCISPGRKFSFAFHSKEDAPGAIMKGNEPQTDREEPAHEPTEHENGRAAIAKQRHHEACAGDADAHD